MTRRFILPILVAAALTGPVHAAPAPRGYVPATVYAKGPGGAHSGVFLIPRKFCGLKIPAYAETDGGLAEAEAGAVCNR